MSLIDRYLIWQYLQSFLICFLSLTGLYIVIDAFGNVDEFVRQGEKSGSIVAVLVEYYAYKSIWFFDATSGILMLIAAMFTVASFQRYNEMTALMAAGISKWRIVRPIIATVLLLTGIAAISREVVIPRFREELSRSTKDFEGETGRKLEPRRDRQTDILLNGKETYASDQRIHQPSFQLLPPELSEYGSQLTARDAYYLPPAENRPGGYLFRGVEHPKELHTQPSLPVGKEPVLITPRDAPWLKPDECFVVSEVTFEQLASGSSWRQFSSTSELISSLHNASLDFGADVRVAIHARLVQPFLDVCLLFLGLPVILASQSRNMFIAVGQGMAVVLAFLLVTVSFHALGTSYLISPALAAWSPLMVFVPAALVLSDPLRQ